MTNRMSPEREMELIVEHTERDLAHAVDLINRPRDFATGDGVLVTRAAILDAITTLERAVWRLTDR